MREMHKEITFHLIVKEFVLRLFMDYPSAVKDVLPSYKTPQLMKCLWNSIFGPP